MFVVFILGLVQNFSSNMFNTTGTAIVAQLSGIEYYTLQFTIFTLVSGIFIPMFGNLGDIQGRRRWLAIGAALFVVGSLTMCAAPTMLVILIGRVIVSVAQAIMSGNYLTLIGEISNEKERPMFMTINGAGIGVAMMLAPILAGFFVDKISWRMVFLFLTVISAIAMILVFAMIPTIKTPAMEQGKRRPRLGRRHYHRHLRYGLPAGLHLGQFQGLGQPHADRAVRRGRHCADRFHFL